jgi:hypothetical protein
MRGLRRVGRVRRACAYLGGGGGSGGGLWRDGYALLRRGAGVAAAGICRPFSA